MSVTQDTMEQKKSDASHRVINNTFGRMLEIERLVYHPHHEGK